MSPPPPAAGPLVHGRFAPGRTLATDGQLTVLRGRDQSTSEEVELVRLEPHAALRDGARERFARAWVPRSPPHPAWMSPLAGPAPSESPVGVRPPTQALWTPAIRLSADEVRQAAGWLGAALLAGAPGLGGALDHRDLVIDAGGVPRISPSGLKRTASVADLPRHRPPVVEPGPAGERDAALYGLGVVLFRALTGAWPADGASPATLHDAQRSPRRARALDPSVPADVDALLAALLDADPAHRAPALAAMVGAGPPVLDLSTDGPSTEEATQEPAATGAPTLRVTQAAPQRSAARLDIAQDPWLVVVDREAATEASLRRLEALLPELPHFALRDSHRDARQLVVGSAGSADAARALMDSLAPAGAPLSTVSSLAPAPARFGQIAGWVLAAVLAPVLGLLLLGPVAAGVGAAAGLVLALVGGMQVRRSKDLARSLVRPGTDPAVVPTLPARQRGVLDAVRTARKAVMEGDLADPLRVDLLGSLDDIESATLTVPDADADELAALAAAAEEVREVVGTAVQAADPTRSRAAVDAARRRAAAARAALRQT